MTLRKKEKTLLDIIDCIKFPDKSDCFLREVLEDSCNNCPIIEKLINSQREDILDED